MNWSKFIVECCGYLSCLGWVSVFLVASVLAERQTSAKCYFLLVSNPRGLIDFFLKTQPKKISARLSWKHLPLLSPPTPRNQPGKSTTRWSHLPPWPLSGTIPLPHPAPPLHQHPHPPLLPLLPQYLPWPRTCPSHQHAGQWRTERAQQRREPMAVRHRQTRSAGSWIFSGWDIGSLCPSCWRWERGLGTDAGWEKINRGGQVQSYDDDKMYRLREEAGRLLLMTHVQLLTLRLVCSLF